MVDYIGTFHISCLPFCQEKLEMINGVEKTCLVIPCDDAQFVRTRKGGWCVKLLFTHLDPNPQLRASKISLSYRTQEDKYRGKRDGSFYDTLDMGFLYVNERNKALKKDRTNNMTPIFCDGRLFLDSIQREDIKVDPNTGRKYVDFAFRKSQLLDAFGNSHEVVVRTDYGEHQIGVAKEIRDEEGWFTPTQQSQHESNNENKQSPTEYEGYQW